MTERVIEIRPARIQARYVEIGDMLVSSPIGTDGARPSRWIGRVEQRIEPADADGVVLSDHDRDAWRQWRVAMVDGNFMESHPIPADGFVWVHLPGVTELTGGL
jgi:hypothetical protein